MNRVRSGDADLFYAVRGSGPDVILLHPFPVHHRFWDEVTPYLEERYRLILPDLRGMGESQPGEGPVTMAKHAADLITICRDANVGRAIFAGVSIGGYILMELWRQAPERFQALALVNTKATIEDASGKAGRLQAADDILLHGPAKYLEERMPQLFGETTRRNRPDIVQKAMAMANRASAAGLAGLLRGMAERPDSTADLVRVNVPTLLVGGDEDTVTPVAESQAMHRAIRGSRLEVIPRAGHYSPIEQPEVFGKLMRGWLDSLM